MNFFEMKHDPFPTKLIGSNVRLCKGRKVISTGKLSFVGVAPIHAARNRLDVVTITIGRTPLTFTRKEFNKLNIQSWKTDFLFRKTVGVCSYVEP